MCKKVLVVDDDPDLLCAMSIRLKASGYKTVVAGDASSAIRVAQEEKPDLILLDLGLPDGDGFSVMRKLKASPALSTIPVIVVTARDPMNNLQAAYKAGATAFFQKPFRNELLLSILERTCANRKSETTKKILVVDDDQEHLRAMKIRLTAANYEVVFAEDGIAAISMSIRERPDLIILDLGLPGGDGFITLFRLKQNPLVSNIPVIVLTGQDPSSREDILKGGAHSFFQKPADTGKLNAAILDALEVRPRHETHGGEVHSELCFADARLPSE